MKRILSILLAVMVTLGAWAASGSAGKNIKWELKDGTLTFTGSGPMKDFGKERPFRADLVKRAVVGEGITSVGRNAMRECENLYEVELPGSLNSVGANAFSGCTNLTEVRLPYGVESIGEEAFRDCRSFIQIELPVSLKAIGHHAFAGCSNMTYARLATATDAIGKNAFDGCKSLAELDDLPPYVTTSNYMDYGLNRAAVKKFWDKKEEIAQRFGAASGGQAPAQKAQAKAEPSDVDLNIPFTGREATNTFVVVIANENYGKLANVPFALNDGNTFALYCRRTLGVPEKNILQYNDATYGSMKAAMSDLRMINDVVGDDMKVIFYYAGHGAPDDATLEPFLIPVDAPRVNKDVCLPLASVYADLGRMRLRQALVFLDACFSGATRDGSMVVAARGIARVPKAQGLSGNIAVFTATSGEQTALPYNEKGHGMFTYYLLKQLQQSEGNLSLGELKDALNQNVTRQSTIVNRKDQTPTVLVSPAISSQWDSWKIND